LSNVTIPGSVTGVAYGIFFQCHSLASITLPDTVTYIGGEAFFGCYSLTNVFIPGRVTSIGNNAFRECTNLAFVTIARGVGYIGEYAFMGCNNLRGAIFMGNAPSLNVFAFYNANNATIYYLSGTTGWGVTIAGRPTSLWNPLMQSTGPYFGVGSGGFGFKITGTTNIPIVVEACTNPANAAWVPLQSLNLTNGAFYFSEPVWTNYLSRNYRIRSP
jgi:hypothetical protein